MSAGSVTGQDAELLELAREFAAGEVTPNAAEWDAARALPEAFLSTLAEMGFFGMPIAEEFGGLGLSASVYHRVLAALAEADASVALTVAAHGVAARVVQRHAPSDLRQALLEQMATGEVIGTTALLEGGTDVEPLHFSTRVDGAQLHGAKRGVINASHASLFVVGAVQDGVPVMAFVRGGNGISVTGRATTMGLCAAEFGAVEFDGTPLAGVASDASGAYLDQAAAERAGIAAVALGIARGSLADALRYADERSQFGSSLSAFDAIKAKLADVAVRCAGTEAALLSFAEMLEADTEAEAAGRDAEGAALKILATESAMFASDEAVQIFGGYGYMRDYPVEKRMRDAKGTEVTGGTSEALKRVLADRILDAARSS